MKRNVIVIAFSLVLSAVAFSASAKLKYENKGSKDYDFKAVEKIVVMPITSEGVDFGKVDAERKPKIEAILEKTKKNMRTDMVNGAKKSKTTIPFYLNPPNKKPTTLLLKFNITQFDNGNQAARLIPMVGKAKVTVHGQFIEGQSKRVVADMTASVKEKGGLVPGGLDSEVLWNATNRATSEIMRHLMKLTDMDYSFWSGVTKGSGDAIKSQKDVIKEEKREVDNAKKKRK